MNKKTIKVSKLYFSESYNTYLPANNIYLKDLGCLAAFFNNGGPSIAKTLKGPDFFMVGVNSDDAIVCPRTNNICFIYYPLTDFFDTLNDLGNEEYKYLNPENSFQISKDNYILISQLWYKAVKKKSPFLLLWMDKQGTTHLQDFQDEQSMNKKEEQLLKDNIILEIKNIKGTYTNQDTWHEEPITFYLKTYKQIWDGYSCKARIPKHGVGEILRILSPIEDPNELSSDGKIMKGLNNNPPELWYPGIDNIGTDKNSEYSYIFPFYHGYQPYADGESWQTMLPKLNSKNSIKLPTKNILELFESWRQILINKPECVLIWQNIDHWVYLESFDNEQAMTERVEQLEQRHYLK